MASVKIISSPHSGPTPMVEPKDIAAPEIALSERVYGALLCSIDATIWMVQVGLIFVIWSIKLTLMVGIAVLMTGFRGRR
jgi:hypothetical protein